MTCQLDIFTILFIKCMLQETGSIIHISIVISFFGVWLKNYKLNSLKKCKKYPFVKLWTIVNLHNNIQNHEPWNWWIFIHCMHMRNFINNEINQLNLLLWFGQCRLSMRKCVLLKYTGSRFKAYWNRLHALS